jgi:hypothetical protein
MFLQASPGVVAPGRLEPMILSISPSSYKPILPRPPSIPAPRPYGWPPIQFQPFRDLGNHNPRMPIYISPNRSFDPVSLGAVPVQSSQYRSDHPSSSSGATTYASDDSNVFDDDPNFNEVLVQSLDEVEKTYSLTRRENIKKNSSSDGSAHSLDHLSQESRGVVIHTGSIPLSVDTFDIHVVEGVHSPRRIGIPTSAGITSANPSAGIETGGNQRHGLGGINVGTFNLNIMNVSDFEEVWKLLRG